MVKALNKQRSGRRPPAEGSLASSDGRLQRSAATHARLMEAALRIASTEGSAALNTVRLTSEAKIAQSGFYRYFDSIDACLEAAVMPIATTAREAIARSRSRLLALGSDDLEPAIAHYEEILTAVTASRDLAELLVRRRFEASPVGRIMTGVMQASMDDLARDMEEMAAASGMTLIPEETQAVAHLLVMAVLGAIEALLSPQPLPVRALAESLARMGKATFEWALRPPAPAPGRSQRTKRR